MDTIIHAIGGAIGSIDDILYMIARGVGNACVGFAGIFMRLFGRIFAAINLLF